MSESDHEAAGRPRPQGQGGDESLERFGYEQELRRTLGLRDLLVYGMVFMVPIAPFAIFGVVFDTAKGMVPLTYVIGLVAMVFTALSYREMSQAFPIAGSVYAYAGRGLRPEAGFLAGWAILLDYLLVPTLLYVTGAVALQSVIGGVPQWLWIVVFVVFNTSVNMLGIRTTAQMNKLFLLAELIILAMFVVLSVIAINDGKNGAHWTTTPFYDPHVFSVGLVFSALSVAALSFLGFDAISTLAEEVRGGRKVVGRATLLSLCLVAALFVVQTYLAALLLPGRTSLPNQAAENTAFYDVARIAGGVWFKDVVAVSSALAAAVANSLAAQAATSRLLFSMARDGQLPRFLAHVHPTRKVPERAVLLVAVISLGLGLGLVGQVGLLSSLVNFGALFSFLMLHVSVMFYFLVRRREHTYGMHLVVPLIGFAIIGYVLYNADSKAQIGGSCWLVIGIAILLVRKLTGRSTELKLDA
ncbi:APC family permease [Streptomyces sp. PTM05]|uniref:APC family permease n=1 Tax=Streptantibioticus parmotrematis TaxID=2873249 RepID=A0ABS7QLH4_9ACTN|nr:APC family permease [Streptantibioticus parmotrematis]MBY8883519.1 APC family permease [Streptantibioticus parmotrematis]